MNNYYNATQYKGINPINQINNRFVGQAILTVLVFLLNPLLGLCFSFYMAYKSSENYRYNKRELLFFIIIICIWISLINVSKRISGDQLAYTRQFLLVPKMGFVGTLFRSWDGSGKEPFYSLIVWLLYYATFGSTKAFYFILSCAIYLFNFLAVYTLYKQIKAPKGALLCGIIVLTFFSQYFAMTLQLIRQFLAASIVIYALVWRATKGKNNWWLLVAAVLIHTSAIFIAGLSLIPWFYKWIPKRRVYVVLIGLAIMVVGNTYIAGLLGSGTGIEVIDYGLSKYGEEELSDGIGGANSSIMATAMIIIPIMVPLAVASIALLWRYNMFMVRRNYNRLHYLRPLLPYIYICIILMTFVLSFGKSPLIQYRFFYYTYSFLPILLPMLFAKIRNAKAFWFLLSAFLILRFFITFDGLVWKYPPVLDLFYQPVTYYFSLDTLPPMEDFYVM